MLPGSSCGCLFGTIFRCYRTTANSSSCAFHNKCITVLMLGIMEVPLLYKYLYNPNTKLCCEDHHYIVLPSVVRNLCCVYGLKTAAVNLYSFSFNELLHWLLSLLELVLSLAKKLVSNILCGKLLKKWLAKPRYTGSFKLKAYNKNNFGMISLCVEVTYMNVTATTGVTL